MSGSKRKLHAPKRTELGRLGQTDRVIDKIVSDRRYLERLQKASLRNPKNRGGVA